MPKAKGDGTYEFNLRPGAQGFNQWEGINTSSDPAIPRPSQPSVADNVRPLAGGYCERGGQSLLDTVTGTVTGIFDATAWTEAPPPANVTGGTTNKVLALPGNAGGCGYVDGSGTGATKLYVAMPGIFDNPAGSGWGRIYCNGTMLSGTDELGGSYAPEQNPVLQGIGFKKPANCHYMDGLFVKGRNLYGFRHMINGVDSSTTARIIQYDLNNESASIFLASPSPFNTTESPNSYCVLSAACGYKSGYAYMVSGGGGAGTVPIVTYVNRTMDQQISSDAITVSSTKEALGPFQWVDTAMIQLQEDLLIVAGAEIVDTGTGSNWSDTPRIRKFQIQHKTWSDLSIPADLTSFAPKKIINYKGNAYVFGAGQLTSKPGSVGKGFSGPVALKITPAGVVSVVNSSLVDGTVGNNMFLSAVVYNTILYYIPYTRNTVGGVYQSKKLGTFDGTTWSNSAIDLWTALGCTGDANTFRVKLASYRLALYAGYYYRTAGGHEISGLAKAATPSGSWTKIRETDVVTAGTNARFPFGYGDMETL